MLASLTIAQHMLHRMLLSLLLYFPLGTRNSCASRKIQPGSLLQYQSQCMEQRRADEENLSQQQWLSLLEGKTHEEQLKSPGLLSPEQRS